MTVQVFEGPKSSHKLRGFHFYPLHPKVQAMPNNRQPSCFLYHLYDLDKRSFTYMNKRRLTLFRMWQNAGNHLHKEVTKRL